MPYFTPFYSSLFCVVNWTDFFSRHTFPCESFKKKAWMKITKLRYCSPCLKIAKKVAFNIASEASYIYILNGHKLIKKWSILASFWKPDVCGQTVLPDRSLLIGQKSVEKAKIRKLKMWHFSWFSNTVFLFSWTQSPKGVKHLHFSYL